MKRLFLFLLVALPLSAAPLPQTVRDAVQRLRTYDYTQPRGPLYALVQFTPRADAEQRQTLAQLLAETVIAPGIAPLGRTILCQQLALVAGDAEQRTLAALLADPKRRADARLVLEPVAPPPAPPSKSACLAQSTDPKPAARIAGLASLARFHPGDAPPVLLKAIADNVASVHATAIQLLSGLDGATLAAQLPRLDAPRQALAIGALAEHRVTAARAPITELVTNSDEPVRLAAISALGALGDLGCVQVLHAIAAGESDPARMAALNALAQLDAPGVERAILNGISTGTPASRVVMIEAATLRAQRKAIPQLLLAATEQDPKVQSAALLALGRLAGADVYSPLVELLARVQNPALNEAIAAVGRRVEPMQARVAPLLVLLKRADISEAAQAAALRALALTGGTGALAAVRERLGSQDAAVRALVDWPNPEALEDLYRLVQQPATTPVHRSLAFRSLLRLAPASGQPVSWLTRAKGFAKTTAEKQQWLGALSELKDPAAVALAEQMSADPDVSVEAKLAADKIDVALGGKSKQGEARRAALAKTLPIDAKLVAYVDCGAEMQDRSGTLRLRVQRGNNWTWHTQDNPTASTAAFAGGHVDLEATGFDEKKCYTLGFAWWDYDANGRAQSVWAGAQKILATTPLPTGQQGPAILTCALPPAALRGGKAQITFKQEAKSNCVVSEVWLLESPKPLPVLATPPPAPASPPQKPDLSPLMQPRIQANPGAAKRILIVTGLEYPGHKWRETVPVLTAAIGADKRLEVSVVEDPRFMASPGMKDYDAFVLNYQNHEVPVPDGALACLKSAVESGRGLVLVHFACGAFIDWPTRTVAKDFLTIAGRVWNPKLRGHDPRGPFTVNITDTRHPITKGLSDFVTEDELYTCLDGDVPIQVLAKATSKVDHKDYAMAFTLMPGKGRTFHCVLGHDVKALSPGVGQLYRQGTAWAVGLPD